MESTTAGRLVEINRDFYTRFGNPFSATRHRLQPGVWRLLGRLGGDESILDLGGGNGELARELSRRGHRGSYLGLDFSLPLLREAQSQPEGFAASFAEADLTRLAGTREEFSKAGGWSWITAFAFLHHVPSSETRLDILRIVHSLLAANGIFILSNWQFLNCGKWRARIQDWSKVGLSAGDVDPGDYLLDWRSEGVGLRYVHHFSTEELQGLAGAAGFQVLETFYSDGETGNLGLYQVWSTVPDR